MQILTANSLSDAFQTALDLLTNWAINDPAYFWFRGINDCTLSLQPGAYWRTKYKELEPLVTFVQEGIAFADIGELDCWDTYYLAQHHGIPTRLLDWTESFSAALFFAFARWDGCTTPCIWIMQPDIFNMAFLGWSGILAPQNTEQTKFWLPRNIAKPHHLTEQDSDGYLYDNEWPMAIYPRKTNRRIAAQQGVFTVHGRKADSLIDLVAARGADIESVFARVDLSGFDKDTILNQLNVLGVRRSAIYPDVDNFVKQIQDYFKW